MTEEMSRVEIDGVRYYCAPDGGVYPSVTTVLGVMISLVLISLRKKRFWSTRDSYL